MILLTVLALIFPALAGWTLSRAMFQVQTRSSWLTFSALTLGLGFGVFSSVMLVLLLIFGPSQKALIVTEIIVAFGMALYNVKHGFGSRRPEDPSLVRAGAQPPAVRILALCFYLVLAASLTTSVVLIIRNPHGQLDAWAIWNLKARYIFRGGANWRAAFSTVL